ncbi:E3 ubiquitin-protein ligase, putative [Plasmodium chabaudi adami]|uniref:E3 ubiquitin-protein ligase, putative n=1 Tax=Plasmodium chabaudi adami TaxID=5826 RepID=A0A1D3RTC8_PLACE|nr:E3 ubiquitin-protein ligase, putative [Plasmodium chabaudi adami]
MSITDEYDLGMYKNLVLSNSCKNEDLLCIFNSSSFLNTICFFIFIIIVLWSMTILSRIYLSYSIVKFLRNRKAIYMKNLSKYIEEIKILCRSHVNDIIRIKKKITPKVVERINLNISINKNIQLFKNYLSSSASDLNNYYKYSIAFTFSSKNCTHITLYWGVLLKEVNDFIYKKSKKNKKKKGIDKQNTIISIGNIKTFLREGFNKTLPKKKTTDATTFLLNKKTQNEFYYQNEEDDNINFTSCYYKTSNSFFTSGNNISYNMPYDENFCVNDILHKIEEEKRLMNNSEDEIDLNEINKNNKFTIGDSSNNDIDNHIESLFNETSNVRIPLIIVLQEVSPNGDKYMSSNDFNSNFSSNEIYSANGTSNTSSYATAENVNANKFDTTNSNYNSALESNGIDNPNSNNNTSNTLIVLVDFKKNKDKYKPILIKDICIANENKLPSTQKSKKKNNQSQFIDILDIYGHEEHDKECLICMASYKDTLLMPCRHSSFCYDCMKSLRQEKCPICRCLFTSFIKFPLKNINK